MLMRYLVILLLLGAGQMAFSASLVANGPIRAQTIIGPEDIALVDEAIFGALSDPAEAIGLEARVNLYPGRAIRAGDLGPPAIIDRNEIVLLQYQAGNLTIMAEGRALDRGAQGALLRVMNLGSRATVTGRVSGPGVVTLSASLP